MVIVVIPPDDETDMNKLEKHLRSIQMEGVVCGACKSWCISNTFHYVSKIKEIYINYIL